MPTMMLTESAAAATVSGLINSVGQLSGFGGNWIISFLNDRTHSLTASFTFIALVYVAAGSLILGLKIQNPVVASQSLNPMDVSTAESASRAADV